MLHTRPVSKSTTKLLALFSFLFFCSFGPGTEKGNLAEIQYLRSDDDFIELRMDVIGETDLKTIIVFVKDAAGNLLYERKQNPQTLSILFRLNKSVENNSFVIGINETNGKKIQLFTIKPIIKISNEIEIKEF